MGHDGPVITHSTTTASDLAAALRVPPGQVDLTAWPTDATPGFDGDKAEGKRLLGELGDPLGDLQERLFAEGVSGAGERAVLLVLQGMDTSGKGGVVRNTVGLVDPQGVRITSFKAPTPEELEHDFLWRIRQGVPGPGKIGVFDRSHYEDVLIGRVRSLVSPEELERRYDAINDFEQELVTSGVHVLKVMLHVSRATQRERLLARLDDPTKHWKFEPGDIDDRGLWDGYQRAYEIALERTSTEIAPWHVIPADRKWFRNLAVGRLLLGELERMAPQWPGADFDVEEQRGRLQTETA